MASGRGNENPASEAIIDVLPPSDSRPKVTYRYGGDRYVLVEYGDMELSLFYNLRAMGLAEALKEVRGIVETVPSFRSLLVHYEDAILPFEDLMERLKACEEQLGDVEALRLPSRLIELPIAFGDRWTREYIAWYAKNIRADAPNIIEGHNIAYVAKYNGLTVDELKERILESQWWTAGLGFWPGLPFFLPLHPLCMITAPKYNPTRPRTPEGTVGIGGPCVAIYPIESPGGYQLLGRSIQIYDIKQQNPVFRKNPILFQPADRVKFVEVGDDELEEIRRKSIEGSYRYRITSYEIFDVRRYVEWRSQFKEEFESFMRRQEESRRAVPVP